MCSASSVSERHFFATTYAMIALASLCILVRVGIQVSRKKAPESQDYLIYVAFVFFLAMSISYLKIVPHLDRMYEVGVGALARWPTMEDDAIRYNRILFWTPIWFWTALWLAKLSLLALCKKLMEGLPKRYTRFRQAVLIFCWIVSCPAPWLQKSLLNGATVSGRLLGSLHHIMSQIRRQTQTRRMFRHAQHRRPAS